MLREGQILCLCFVSVLLSPQASRAGSRFDLPEGPGRELVYGHCQTCHDLQSVVDSAGIRKGAWAAVLDNMNDFGLRISEEQHSRILNYLGTYLGPQPPAETTGTASVADGGEAVDGAAVYADTCISCHQEDGKGKPGEFPPFAGNGDLFLNPTFPAAVALYGIEGKIEVDGKAFDNVMPPFDFLSDAEIAAVVGYIRSNWGNEKLRPADLEDPAADDVAALRTKEMSSEDIYALRSSLRQ
ncbi:c-type cytochrome [Roseibium aggregatum]|uniref:Cytochrome c n=1 Tax=Roseibium aggregatum TaxID=187304 RepID=A0A926NWW7_9HYPH|nr:cytochrome c [Roseibium aggregatum]MBD1545595.1 cytochrome c [Roseibium aggregatum]